MAPTRWTAQPQGLSRARSFWPCPAPSRSASTPGDRSPASTAAVDARSSAVWPPTPAPPSSSASTRGGAGIAPCQETSDPLGTSCDWGMPSSPRGSPPSPPFDGRVGGGSWWCSTAASSSAVPPREPSWRCQPCEGSRCRPGARSVGPVCSTTATSTPSRGYGPTGLATAGSSGLTDRRVPGSKPLPDGNRPDHRPPDQRLPDGGPPEGGPPDGSSTDRCPTDRCPTDRIGSARDPLGDHPPRATSERATSEEATNERRCTTLPTAPGERRLPLVGASNDGSGPVWPPRSSSWARASSVPCPTRPAP